MSQKEIAIFVEGKSDRAFLLALLSNGDKYEIFATNGKDNLSNTLEKMKNRLPRYDRICIIFDADNDYKATLNKLKKQIEYLENYQKIEIFLFPNNKDDGELETLLENIAIEPKLIQCFDCYKKCIGEVDENYLKNIDKKSKYYAYIEAFGNSKNKEKTNAKAFDMNSDYIKPLKEFLGIND